MGRATLTSQVSVGAQTDQVIVDLNTDNEQQAKPVGGVAAAKSGNLTTRTSDTVGTLTMAAGHGILTGDILDIYWTVSGGGSRLGVTVGTVSGNDVPFTLGSGDNLPADESAITAKVPQVEAINVDNTAVQGISCYSASIGVVRFLESDDTEIFAKELTAGETYVWVNGSGVTNPLTAVATQVTFSHGQTSAVLMHAKAVYN